VKLLTDRQKDGQKGRQTPCETWPHWWRHAVKPLLQARWFLQQCSHTHTASSYGQGRNMPHKSSSATDDDAIVRSDNSQIITVSSISISSVMPYVDVRRLTAPYVGVHWRTWTRRRTSTCVRRRTAPYVVWTGLQSYRLIKRSNILPFRGFPSAFVFLV